MKKQLIETSSAYMRNVIAGLTVLILCGMVAPQIASAATSANATIFNEATVTYDFLTLTNQTASDFANVTVDTLAAAPTVTVDTTAQSTVPNGNLTYTYTVRSNSNGPDTYTLTTPITSSDAPAGAFATSSTNTPSSNSVVLFGGIIVSSGAGVINLPGGSVAGNLVNGDTVAIGVNQYTVTNVAPGNAESTGTPEVFDVVTLAPVGASPAIGAGLDGTQVGQYITNLTNSQTAGTFNATFSSGTHTVNLTFTTTATDGGGSAVVYTTSAGDSNETITTVAAADITVVKTADVATAQPGDTITYTITVTNNSATTSTANATLTDPVPAYTSYVPNSTTLNGGAVTDGAGSTSPLIAGILIDGTNTGDAGTGVLAPGATATVVFQVTVD